MADPSHTARPTKQMPSTSFAPVPADADSSSIRPRNRRLISTEDSLEPRTQQDGSPDLLTFSSAPGSRDVSPAVAARTTRNSSRASSANPASTRRPSPLASAVGRNLFEQSWGQGWTSVQQFATSLLSPDQGPAMLHGSLRTPRSRSGSRSAPKPARPGGADSSWGPEPPASQRPRHTDIGAGGLAERDAALRAAKTASVLESYEGVNGGLDVAGRFKRRNSSEAPRSQETESEVEDRIVYIHHVRPNDTYAGITLRYRCQGDEMRKANGLWSRDAVQARKWLAIPVDACDIKGRPCEGPAKALRDDDLLAFTPDVGDGAIPGGAAAPAGRTGVPGQANDFFSLPVNGSSHSRARSEIDEQLWTHVRWVKVDSIEEPIEVARISRKTLGYFPPRRKKSLHTSSGLSSPRQSVDGVRLSLHGTLDGNLSTGLGNVSSSPVMHQAASETSGVASHPRSRANSGTPDVRPPWMRRPGGVGSLGRNVKAPGPEKDYFNTWAKRHFPGLNIDSMPSMSVMGSETARFGMRSGEVDLVESPFDDGHDTTATSRQGSGLDRAAAAVETWLRGALAIRPGTPIIGPRAKGPDDGDLIELEDANSDDGRGLGDLIGPGVSTNFQAAGDSNLAQRRPGVGPQSDRPPLGSSRGKKMN